MISELSENIRSLYIMVPLTKRENWNYMQSEDKASNVERGQEILILLSFISSRLGQTLTASRIWNYNTVYNMLKNVCPW